MVKFISNSVSQTENIAEMLGKSLKGNEVITFFGGLGMGKTAFTRGIAKAVKTDNLVTSPTFALMNQYTGKFNIFHFDMYRIETWDDLYSTGFFDYIGNGIIIIEWSENIENALPENYIRIVIEKGESDSQRIITIDGIDVL